MKHLLLLLFTTTCLAQHAKVTAYRLINDYEDGPCSVKTYVENPLMSLLTYVTAESNDPIFTQNLLKLKKDARKWKKTDYFCSSRVIGGSMIHNMFVISYNGVNDTILSTLNNDMIIFPGEEKAYSDKKEMLKKMLPENISKFFNHDFTSPIMSYHFPEKNDSIKTDKILYNGKYASDIFNEDFDEHPYYFNKISQVHFGNDDVEKTYTYNKDTIRHYYYKRIEITITNPESDWNVDGIKVGDSEEKFIAKYPESAKIKKFNNIRYEDIVRKYFYWVMLRDNKGSITYFIKDGVIENIYIYFN